MEQVSRDRLEWEKSQHAKKDSIDMAGAELEWQSELFEEYYRMKQLKLRDELILAIVPQLRKEVEVVNKSDTVG
jgi:hypothetical protein